MIVNNIYREEIRDTSYYPSDVPIGQYNWEFEHLLLILEGKKINQMMEIGTHSGGSLRQFAKVFRNGTRILALDDQHINADKYDSWNSKIKYIKADSTDKNIQKKIKDEWGYFDFIFIDGDHSYEGVKSDWEFALTLYPKIVALHDITAHPNRDVLRLWRKIQWKGFVTQELIGDAVYPDGCGIGVVYFD